MLRTIFFLAIMVWMLGLMLQFGGSALHLLLVIAAIMLVMKHVSPPLLLLTPATKLVKIPPPSPGSRG